MPVPGFDEPPPEAPEELDVSFAAPEPDGGVPCVSGPRTVLSLVSLETLQPLIAAANTDETRSEKPR